VELRAPVAPRALTSAVEVEDGIHESVPELGVIEVRKHVDSESLATDEAVDRGHPVDAPHVEVDDPPVVVVLEDSSRKLAKSLGWVMVSFP
jgi:hypothetical protein